METNFHSSNGDISGYELVREIGCSHNSTVFLATSADSRCPSIAVKHIRHAVADADYTLIQQQIAVLRAIENANIAQPISVLKLVDGLSVAMPFAEGGTLADRLRVSPMEPRDAIALVVAIATALSAAHVRAVVHRAVKPTNIGFFADDTPKLLDFSLPIRQSFNAATLDANALAYLAPEVVKGADHSPRSDQYALGVVAYEALVGYPPFAGADPFSMMQSAEFGAFEHLDRARFGVIAEIVEKAFHRDPQQRFKTLGAFASALTNPDEYIAGSQTNSVAAAMQPTITNPASVFVSVPLLDGRLMKTARAEAGNFQTLVSTANYADHGVRAFVRSHMKATAAFAVLLCGVVGMTFLQRASASASLPAIAPAKLPECTADLTFQCVQSITRLVDGVKVSFADGTSSTFTVGRTTDIVRANNWFCGEHATLALYRPSTGVLYYASAWPSTETTPTTVFGDFTGIANANVSVSDYDNNGCADIALDKNGKRTWFSPSLTPKRLQPVDAMSKILAKRP
jgi:hypothetical protein